MRGGWRACAGRCARRDLVRPHLQPINRSPMFDSLQFGPGAPAAITATIAGEVAVVLSAAASSFFDDTMLSRRYRCCRVVLLGVIWLQGGEQGG